MEPATVAVISKVRGWVLVVLGTGLSVGMAVIGVYLGWIIAHNDRPAGTHWTGSESFTARVFDLLAVIFVFGLVAVGAGIFQLKRGRPSKLAILVLLLLGVVMYFLGESLTRGSAH